MATAVRRHFARAAGAAIRKPDAVRHSLGVNDGALCIPHDDGSDTLGQRDIVSSDEFDTFDLSFEWKVGPGSNSGLKYFVTENRDAAIGHEYQIIDDAAARGRQGGGRRAADRLVLRRQGRFVTPDAADWRVEPFARRSSPATTSSTG